MEVRLLWEDRDAEAFEKRESTDCVSSEAPPAWYVGFTKYTGEEEGSREEEKGFCLADSTREANELWNPFEDSEGDESSILLSW